MLPSSQDTIIVNLITINKQIRDAEEHNKPESIEWLLTKDFTIIRANGVKLGRDDFLKAVSENAGRGRSSSDENVQALGEKYALYTCIIHVKYNAQGESALGSFWNTRLFVREEDGQWRCLWWQVTKKPDEEKK